MSQPPPEMLTLLLCEKAIRDGATGQGSIIGIVSHATCTSFPVRMRLVVFMELTNGRGDVPIRVRIVDVDESRPPVCDTNLLVSFSDPLQVIQLPFDAPGLVFPQPGQYRVQAYVAGSLARERRITLSPMTTPPPGLVIG